MAQTLRAVAAGFALVALLALAGQAAAAPSPASPLIPPVAGEADLTSFVVGPASDLTVDWMVIPGTGSYSGSFLYLYQLENTSALGVPLFTVTVPAGSVTAAGVFAGDDLDLATANHQAHAVGTFPVLAGEEEGFTLASLVAVTTIIDPTNVTWTFAPLAAGKESDTLFFVSPNPPTYGNAVALVSPWGTLAPGADQVPVSSASSVPEPASLLLLGSGLTGLGFWARRRRSLSENIPPFDGAGVGSVAQLVEKSMVGESGDIFLESENFPLEPAREKPFGAWLKRGAETRGCRAPFPLGSWPINCLCAKSEKDQLI